MTIPSDPKRLARLKYRSWHRGTREMDLLLGGFADVWLCKLTPDQLGQYEALLEQADPDLYQWIVSKESFPAEHVCDITELLLEYVQREKG